MKFGRVAVWIRNIPEEMLLTLSCPDCGETVRVARIPERTAVRRTRQRIRKHIREHHGRLDYMQRQKLYDRIVGEDGRDIVLFEASDPPDWH